VDPSEALSIYDYRRNVTITTSLDREAYQRASVSNHFSKIDDPEEREILIKTSELELEKYTLHKQHAKQQREITDLQTQIMQCQTSLTDVDKKRELTAAQTKLKKSQAQIDTTQK
jgi:hypothetical protein